MKPALLIIINPKAGAGKGPEIKNHLGKSGLQDRYAISIAETHYRAHATELAGDAVKSGFAVVVAVGGDGTVNEVASALAGSDTALAIIPCGSGNGLAGHLKYPKNVDCALKKIAAGNVTSIDSININNRFAVNVSGFGFDGFVAWEFDRSGKRGLASYTTIALKEYFRYPSVEFTITIDDKTLITESHMVVIANASEFGNAAIIAPGADVSDGLMDIIIVRRPPLQRLLQTFIHLFRGTLQSNADTQMYQCRKVTIKASHPVHLHIDGEPHAPLTEVSAVLNRGNLKVIM